MVNGVQIQDINKMRPEDVRAMAELLLDSIIARWDKGKLPDKIGMIKEARASFDLQLKPANDLVTAMIKDYRNDFTAMGYYITHYGDLQPPRYEG